MQPVDLRIAPPRAVVDGLLGVPIHIRRMWASVVLDCATATATATATMDYVVGPHGGNPMFDLRQRVEGCLLDGVPIDPDLVRSRDVGAGEFESIRVLEVWQGAGTAHTLKVRYRIGLPDAELGGPRPPALTWLSGLAVRWRFGMSDLNAGRYLEAWFPSNLPFDQFPFRLDVRICRTRQAHVLISNGEVTTLGMNRWSIAFPSTFTTLSPLLEIHPRDTMRTASGVAVLPMSRTAVVVQAWRPVGLQVDLDEQIQRICRLLANNERAYGAFAGRRFVCIFHSGSAGMEYSQACTTSIAALAHEVLHSWFGRGVAPASQADGWWDEGFARFHEDGGTGIEPFDFGRPAVELCSRRPLDRTTPRNAYVDGSRVFRGIAAVIGLDGLRSAMRSLYQQRRYTPVSTADLEAHLVARSGQVSLVDAFHRFVYGFGDPCAQPQLALGQPGGDSPDIWVRHRDDGGLTHQPPQAGRDNWLYARVRNHLGGGACRHVLVVFSLAAAAAGPPSYPRDFLPGVCAAAGFDLRPGESTVVSARWPAEDRWLPAARCRATASVHARGCHPVENAPVWEQTTLAQRLVLFSQSVGMRVGTGA